MTAKQKIINRINETGRVDNFWCIDNYITTRLGAFIFTLKKAGWDFKTEIQEDKNCVYICTRKPTESVINSTAPKGFSFTYKVYEPITNFRDPQ